MPSTETAQRKLVRRTDHRLVAGVASGLADATGSDPLWWRVAFVVVTPVGGLGVVAYLLLWWLIPRADLLRSAGQRLAAHVPDAPSWLGVGLLMLGAVLLARQLGLWTPSISWALLLIGLGVVLYRRETDRGSVRSTADAPASGWEVAPPVSDDVWPPAPVIPAVAAAPRRPRERAFVGWLSLGMALVVGGVMWALRDAGATDATFAQMLAAPLAVLGAGLLLASFVGRGRWTILPALLLVPPALLASLIRVPLDGIWENRNVTPRTAADIGTSFEQSGANLVFDFTKLQPGEHPAPIRAAMGIGTVQVVVPKGIPMSIGADVGLGSLSLLGQLQRSGFGLDGSARVQGADPIVLEAEVGVGTVEVYSVMQRQSEPAPPSAHRSDR